MIKPATKALYPDHYVTYKEGYGHKLLKAIVSYSPNYDFEAERELVAICRNGGCLHIDDLKAGFLEDMWEIK